MSLPTEAALRAALADGGVVTFATNLNITIADVIEVADGNTTISSGGWSVSISGGGNTGIFDVETNLLIDGITLRSGKSQYGGALYVRSNLTVLVTNCSFISNVAAGTNGTAGADGQDRTSGTGGDGAPGTAGGDARGGALYNFGVVTLANCQFMTNSALGGDGGKGGAGGDSSGTLGVGGNGGAGGAGGGAYGGAIYNANILTIRDCTFTANSVTGGNAGAGGAGGSAVFPGREGAGAMGGLAYGGATHNAQDFKMERSTFSANSAQGGNSSGGGTQSNLDGRRGFDGPEAGGGALYSGWLGGITNCTFYTNVAIGGKGGDGGPGTGTLSFGGDGGNGGNGVGGGVLSRAPLNLSFCTLVNCGAYGGTNGVAGSGSFKGSDGRQGNPMGGNIAGSGGTSLLGNLIGWTSSGYAGSGTFTDLGYNMVYDNSIALGSSSFPNASVLNLGTFGNNGGLTYTVSLLTNSPALDRVPTAISPAADQRGVGRPWPSNTGRGDLSDIGAYELAEPLQVAVTVREGTNGLANTLITLSLGGTNGALLTDVSGAFTTTLSQGTFLLTPSRTNYGFAPASISVPVPPGSNSIQFSAFPLIRIAAGTNDEVTLTGGGIAGLSYTIEVSESASTNESLWLPLTNVLAPIQVTVPTTNGPAQFYRLNR